MFAFEDHGYCARRVSEVSSRPTCTLLSSLKRQNYFKETKLPLVTHYIPKGKFAPCWNILCCLHPLITKTLHNSYKTISQVLGKKQQHNVKWVKQDEPLCNQFISFGNTNLKIKMLMKNVY